MSARDVRYGRQGGRIVAWDDERVGTANVDDMPRCDVCGQPLTLRQPGRHWSCCTECDGCHRPIGPKGQNCDHKPECPKRGKS